MFFYIKFLNWTEINKQSWKLEVATQNIALIDPLYQRIWWTYQSAHLAQTFEGEGLRRNQPVESIGKSPINQERFIRWIDEALLSTQNIEWFDKVLQVWSRNCGRVLVHTDILPSQSYQSISIKNQESRINQSINQSIRRHNTGHIKKLHLIFMK